MASDAELFRSGSVIRRGWHRWGIDRTRRTPTWRLDLADERVAELVLEFGGQPDADADVDLRRRVRILKRVAQFQLLHAAVRRPGYRWRWCSQLESPIFGCL